MILLKETANALLQIIKWVSMVYVAFCDWIGINEWLMLLTIIGIIVLIIYPRNR